MATKRLGAAKKRRRSSTLIANPRRKKRRASSKRSKAAPKRRKRNPSSKRRRTMAKRRSKSRVLAKRRKTRRNPAMGDFKSMLKELPILEIAVAGSAAIFITNLISGVPYIKKAVDEMDAGFAKDAAGGLIGPVGTFAAGVAVMYFGKKSDKVKKIGQFMAYAALFQATNALVGKQVQKGVASTLKTIAGDKKDTVDTTATDTDGGFGGAWISPTGIQYGGLLGAGAYFSPDDDGDFSGAYMSPDTPTFGGAYMGADTPIKISGFGGFN
jgi:hypothetical protein